MMLGHISYLFSKYFAAQAPFPWPLAFSNRFRVKPWKGDGVSDLSAFRRQNLVKRLFSAAERKVRASTEPQEAAWNCFSG